MSIEKKLSEERSGIERIFDEIRAAQKRAVYIFVDLCESLSKNGVISIEEMKRSSRLMYEEND